VVLFSLTAVGFAANSLGGRRRPLAVLLSRYWRLNAASWSPRDENRHLVTRGDDRAVLPGRLVAPWIGKAASPSGR
jgi:hypothetical protein